MEGTSIFCYFAHQIVRKPFGIKGGEDGARTLDLSRDSLAL